MESKLDQGPSHLFHKDPISSILQNPANKETNGHGFNVSFMEVKKDQTLSSEMLSDLLHMLRL